MNRLLDLRLELRRQEMMAAEIAADKRLADMRDFQPDPVWKRFFADAIDSGKHAQAFHDVRFYLDSAERGDLEYEVAFQKADAILREMDSTRRYLAEAVARWDQNAQTRRAQMKRKSWGWQRALAAHLQNQVGGTKDAQLQAIPDSAEGMRVELEGIDVEVFRDGDDICCDDGSRHHRISSASFFRHYLRAGQDKSR